MNDIGRIEDIDLGEAEELILERAETLRGDLRDRMLERIRGMQKPWEKMSEMEQSDVIHGVDRVARKLVRDTLRLVAAQGRTVIDVTVDSLVAKDGIAVKLTMPRGDAGRYAILDAVKKEAILVILDTEAHDGESGPAEPDPDQAEIFGAEGSDSPVMDNTDAGGGDSVESGGRRSRRKTADAG